MAEKKQPFDLVAEQSVLGAMMLSKVAIEKACEKLYKNSFYDAKNQIIFQTIVDLHEKKIPIDLTTLTSELNSNNKINEVGGVSYIADLLSIVPSAANVESYIKIVEDNSMLRNVITTSENISKLAYEHNGEVSDILDEVENKIVGIIGNRRTSEFRSIQEVLSSFQSNLDLLSKSNRDITGIPTGYIDFDRLTSGLHENQLIILAARPAVGKTAFALNIAANVATANPDKTVALFELEMSAEQLASRMVSSLGHIDGRKLISGNLVNEDWLKVNEAKSQLSRSKLFISDDVGSTVGDIKSKCRRLATSENGLDLIIIDHLQLLSMGGNYGNNRQAEMTDISRNLKKLAMELHVPIIALSQLSRGVESREDKRPKMSDLRESGAIEQDADIVMFLYRDDYNKTSEQLEAPDPSIVELILAKHRQGATGKVDLLFHKSMSTFSNFKREPSDNKEKKDNKGEINE